MNTYDDWKTQTPPEYSEMENENPDEEEYNSSMVIDAPQRHVKIRDVRRGKGARSCFTYAVLLDADTDELMICATLDYILDQIEARNYNVID